MSQRAFFALLASISTNREALVVHRQQPQDTEEWRNRDTALYDALLTSERAYRDAVENYEEPPEERQLRERIECRHYIGAALTGRRVEGAEAEYNAELGMPADGIMPWAALEPRQEERQDVATSPSDAVMGQPQMETLRRVFERGNVGFLGVRTPSVPFGHPNFPVMTGGATGASAAEGGTIDAEAATFTQETVEPTRLGARYLMRVEDMARFPAMENILRSDLRTVMTQLRDKQVLSGDGTGSNLTGIRKALESNPKKTDPAMATTISAGNTAAAWTAWLQELYGGVDGIYAGSVSGVRWLLHLDAYKRLGQLFKSADVEASMMDYMGRIGVSSMASNFFPASATVDTITNVVLNVRTSKGDDAVAPVWEGINLIRDPYTGAAKGEVAITAFSLHGFKFLRTAGWKLVGMKLS